MWLTDLRTRAHTTVTAWPWLTPEFFFTKAVVRPFSDFADARDDDAMVGLGEEGWMDGEKVWPVSRELTKLASFYAQYFPAWTSHLGDFSECHRL